VEEAKGRDGVNLTHDLSVWIAALLTLAVFSFLYKDNPLYKFAEHLFVGVSAGYYIVLNLWTVIYPNMWEPLTKSLRGEGVDAARHGCSRPSSATIAGGSDPRPAGGAAVHAPLRKDRLDVALVARHSSSASTLASRPRASRRRLRGPGSGKPPAALDRTGGSSLNAIIFTVGLMTSLLFFFYSREHKGALAPPPSLASSS
jgi:hypothetical protein